MKRRIYVASSWRNEYQPEIVRMLRSIGHEVYDFRNPNPGENGFSWSEIDPNWRDWSRDEYRENLDHPISEKGYNLDFNGMLWANTCLLVLPSGRSAHTEAGWMKGRGKRVFVYMPEECEPELMYKLYDKIITSEEELKKVFKIANSLIQSN